MHIYFEIVSHKDTMFKTMVSVKEKKEFVNLVLEHANDPVKENVLVDPRRNFLQFVSKDNVVTFVRATSDDDRTDIDMRGMLFEIQERVDALCGEKSHPDIYEPSRSRKHRDGKLLDLPIKEISLEDFLSDAEIAALDSIFYKDTDRLMPSVGEIYKNRHGKLYSIVAVSQWKRSDANVVTLREMQKPFGYFTIPLDDFMAKIDRKKHPKAKQTFCFELADFWG